MNTAATEKRSDEKLLAWIDRELGNVPDWRRTDYGRGYADALTEVRARIIAAAFPAPSSSTRRPK